jgi:histidinol-phosphate/aromatic aminotransferase/cobyric acid decarboxylase-like protein
MIRARNVVAQTPLSIHGGKYYGTGDSTAVRHDFSVCLNAFGPAPIIRRAIQNASIEDYPDPFCLAPREAAASRWSCSIEEIAFGAGAAELIHAAITAYLEPDDEAIIVDPAFGEYERAIRLRGVAPTFFRQPEEARGYSALAARIGQRRPRIVVLCAPTTPAGLAITMDDIAVIADACGSAGGLLLLDQAYDAFAEHPLRTPALPRHPAVLHIRSLTKEHALAGLRVGFACGPATVIDAVNRVRVPWSASSMAQAAAVAAMSDEAADHVAKKIATLRSEAVRLRDRCSDLGFGSSRSITHYFTLQVRDATVVREILLERAGILVRDCTSFGLSDSIRVASRLEADNEALLRALAMSELDPFRQTQH